MSGLQGRVTMRPGMANNSPTNAKTSLAEMAIDTTCRDVAMILHPLLTESLHPKTFSGSIALSAHFQDGNLCHLKVLDSDELEPGKPVSTFKSNKDRDGADQVANVLESAIRDLRTKLSTIQPGYFGTITLTIEIESGICKLVTWARERVHRRNAGR